VKVAAVTITFNRLELTKRTIENFNEKTGVDYHLFIDNGSTDGTLEWLRDKHRIELGTNYGIAEAFRYAVSMLDDFDYILKLDNDVETVTDDLVAHMIRFIEKSGPHAVSPLDMMIDPAFYPHVFRSEKLNGYNVQYTSHIGCAFQIAPAKFVKQMCEEFIHLKKGDYAIGSYYRRIGCPPCYLTDLQMNHIGLNQSTSNNQYIL